MEKTILPNTPEAVIAGAVEQFGAQGVFWRFVEDFSATVGFDRSTTDTARIARLVAECGRQFSYLRDEHPAYFKQLSEREGDTLTVLMHIADWAVVSGLPVRHFAGTGASVFSDAYDDRRRHHEEEAAEAERKEAEATAILAARSETVTTIPAPLAPATLRRSAMNLYKSSLGRVIKVSEYGLIGDSYHGGSRPSRRADGTDRPYELAFVDMTDQTEIGIDAAHGEIRSTWSIIMMSGPHRGERAFVHAPSFHPDHMITEEWVLLDYISKDNLVEDLDDADLADLVRLDLEDASGKEIEINAATAFVGDSDKQEFLSFAPPIKVVADEFIPSGFDSCLRIDTYDSRDKSRIADVFMDISSDAPEMEGFRGAWTHGASYISDGRVDLGEADVPAVFSSARINISREAFIARRRAGDFDVKAAAAAVPLDGFKVPSGHADTMALEARAMDFYKACQGRLVKIHEHFIDGVDIEDCRKYEIAIVDRGGDDDVGVTSVKGVVAESVWPVVLMTGVNRGQKGYVAAADFHADGTVSRCMISLDITDNYVRPSRLTDEDLVELVRLDVNDYSERAISVVSAQAFINGSDETTTLRFDPPLAAVVHSFDDPEKFDSMWELNDWDSSQNLAVIDFSLDIESADERLDGYRSAWTTGASYTSHGLIIFGHTEPLPFIPEFVSKRRDFTSSEPLPSPGA